MMTASWSMASIGTVTRNIGIVVLLFMHSVTATGRSQTENPAAGKLLSAEGKHFMKRLAATITLQSLEAIHISHAIVGALNDTSSQVGTDHRNSQNSNEACSYSQVVLTQGSKSYFPNGMPIFQVTIINNCLACSMENIHVFCGDWSSATQVNPSMFRKLARNDCLVNNGGLISPLNSVYFEYVSSMAYPMSVRSAEPCLC